MKAMVRFSIEEIRYYLRGGIFTRSDDPDGAKCIENTALRGTIAELEDAEDGIEAVTARFKQQMKEACEAYSKLKPNVPVTRGVSPSRPAAGSQPESKKEG